MKTLIIGSILLFLVGCTASSGAIIGAHRYYDNGEYHKSLSKALHAGNKYEYSDESAAELDYIVAESYEKLGEINKSKAMYKYIVDKYPETKFGCLARAVLQEK